MTPNESIRGARSRFAPALAGVALLLTGGCASSNLFGPPTAELLMAGPTTNVMVSIPEGWHQVINTANPVIPEMVTPINCLGANETGCATGLTRIGTVRAGSIEKAAEAVGGAVTAGRGVHDVTTVSQGWTKLGKRDGFHHRCTFRDSTATVTAEVAAVASGSTTPDPQGNTEYSVVMVWIKDKPDAPKIEVIDQIVNSALVHGGVPAP